MRPEVRWGLAAAVAFVIGVTCAEPYAQLAAPYYAAVDRLIALAHPWDIISVEVRPGKSHLSTELQLWAWVRRRAEDAKPAAKVQGRVQVGEAIETPMIFWTLLLVWPATSVRQRIVRFVSGVPVFLCLEAGTTAIQLLLPMAQASAMLAGDPDPVTPWDRWSRFLEAGGQFVVSSGLAILVTSLTQRGRRMRSSP